MTPSWTQLPRWAPVLDSIASESKPSDLMNFLVAIKHNPSENWRRKYLNVYREIPGITSWVVKSMSMGCTVSLVGMDVKKLILHICNSMKYKINEEDPLVIWPVGTLPWQDHISHDNDDEEGFRLITMPFNPLDGKMGIIKVRNETLRAARVNSETFCKGSFIAGSITEPPHGRVTYYAWGSCNVPRKLAHGYIFDDLSGDPRIILVGGLLDYNRRMPTLIVKTTPFEPGLRPPMLGVNYRHPSGIDAYVYCCNRGKVFRGKDLFFKTSFEEMNNWSAKWSRLREMEMNRCGSSNASVISLNTLFADYQSNIALRDFTDGRPIYVWNFVLPSVCRTIVDLPPPAPLSLLTDVLHESSQSHVGSTNMHYPTLIPEHKISTRLKVDAVLKKYSDYII